jgi:hypothetical protein
MASMGKIKIADSDYGHQLLGQLLRFPAGKFDDGVDMAALMAMAIDQAHPAITAPTKPSEAPRGAKTIEEMARRYEQRQGDIARI